MALGYGAGGGVRAWDGSPWGATPRSLRGNLTRRQRLCASGLPAARPAAALAWANGGRGPCHSLWTPEVRGFRWRPHRHRHQAEAEAPEPRLPSAVPRERPLPPARRRAGRGAASRERPSPATSPAPRRHPHPHPRSPPVPGSPSRASSLSLRGGTLASYSTRALVGSGSKHSTFSPEWNLNFMPSLALICSSWRRARLRGGRSARGGGGGWGRGGGALWRGWWGRSGDWRRLRPSRPPPRLCPPRATAGPRSGRTRALPTGRASASSRRALGRRRVGSPRPRSARPAAPPAFLGRGRAHGVIAPDARSSVPGREMPGQSPSMRGHWRWGGRRPPSGSSLATPRRPPKRSARRQVGPSGEDVAPESGLDGQRSWAGAEGCRVKKALGHLWARRSRWQAWSPPVTAGEKWAARLMSPYQVFNILSLSFQRGVSAPRTCSEVPLRSSSAIH